VVFPSGCQPRHIKHSTKVDAPPRATHIVFKTVAEKSHVGAHERRGRRKSLTVYRSQPKTPRHHQRVLSSVRGPCNAVRGPQKSCLVQGLMHLSFYLMIAALVILGAEVAYALYQLVNLTL